MNDSTSPKVFFLHLRPVSAGYPALTTLSQDAPAKGGRTVAYTIDDKGVTFGVAKVNKADRYCRATGRKIAAERLAAGQYRIEAGKLPRTIYEELIFIAVEQQRVAKV